MRENLACEVVSVHHTAAISAGHYLETLFKAKTAETIYLRSQTSPHVVKEKCALLSDVRCCHENFFRKDPRSRRFPIWCQENIRCTVF